MSGEVECTLSRADKYLRFHHRAMIVMHMMYTSLFPSFFLIKMNMTKMHVNVNTRSRREGTLQDSGGRLLVVLLEVACVDQF